MGNSQRVNNMLIEMYFTVKQNTGIFHKLVVVCSSVIILFDYSLTGEVDIIFCVPDGSCDVQEQCASLFVFVAVDL
jgi:hypothetical protein